MHSGSSSRTLGKRARASLITVILASGYILAQQKSDEYTFRVNTELILVNVTVRDKSGNPVKDLKREDFTVLEDNKPQQVVSFDLQNTDAVLSSSTTEARLLTTAQ